MILLVRERESSPTQAKECSGYYQERERWTTTGSSYSSGADPFVSLSLTANTTLTWHWTPFVLSIAPQPGHQIQLQWNSLGGHTYDLLFATNLAGPFTPMITGIAGTPPANSYVTPAGPTRAGYFKVLMH